MTRVHELEALATDEAMGVTLDPDTECSVIEVNGQLMSAVVCTHCAHRLIELVGSGEVWGWEEGTNPTSVVAGPSYPELGDDGQGHDFAVIEGRYLVDPWGRHVEGSSPRAAWDMADPADRAEVARLYGNQSAWVRLDRVLDRFVADPAPFYGEEVSA